MNDTRYMPVKHENSLKKIFYIENYGFKYKESILMWVKLFLLHETSFYLFNSLLLNFISRHLLGKKVKISMEYDFYSFNLFGIWQNDLRRTFLYSIALTYITFRGLRLLFFHFFLLFLHFFVFSLLFFDYFFAFCLLLKIYANWIEWK